MSSLVLTSYKNMALLKVSILSLFIVLVDWVTLFAPPPYI